MRKLRPYTIIPSSLYIERSADRELEIVLQDMGRPGYVLVARQMGKTNLLLHARRRHSAGDEVFVYVDASNLFPDVRSFFRNIIDLALELRPDKFSSLAYELNFQRGKEERLAHKEHESELRALLGCGVKKLIVCIDEIDALGRSDFSDQIFSFIRSVYFSGRSNFEDLYRLTYLLSGVAEPTDIIKNKDISPFNIGAKIFLDDFSRDEVGAMARRAGLGATEAVLDRLYEWTSGYPRMTWDVCAEIEDFAMTGRSLLAANVDQFVRKLYFGDVEAPPIDHIKKLAGESREIRDALISIHYKKSETISEKLRTRLYLAGISRMAAGGHAVTFKNRVLEESLSERFLLSTTSSESSIGLAEALAALNAGSFDDAILRTPHFPHSSDPDILAEASRIRGLAYFGLGRFPEAAAELRLAIGSDEITDRAELVLRCGYCLRITGRPSDAVHVLETIKDNRGALDDLIRAEFALALSDLGERHDEALEVFDSILANPAAVLSLNSIVRPPTETLVLISIEKSNILRSRGSVPAARSILEDAFKYASLNSKVRLYLTLSNLSDSRRPIYIRQAKAAIETCDGFLHNASNSQSEISMSTLFDTMLAMAHEGHRLDVERLLDKVLSKKGSGLSNDDILQELCDLAQDKGYTSLTTVVLDRSLRATENINPERARMVLQSLLLISPLKFDEYIERYLNTFSANTTPERLDLLILNNIIVSEITPLPAVFFAKALEIVRRSPLEIEEFTERQRACLDQLRAYLTVYSGLLRSPSAAVISEARSLYDSMVEKDEFDLPGFAMNHVARMKEALGNKLRRHGIFVGLRKAEKIGRNEIVEVTYSGKLVTGKYKYLKDDIDSGKSQFIRRLLVE